MCPTDRWCCGWPRASTRAGGARRAYALDPVAEHTYGPAVLLGVREVLASDRSAVVHGATAWHVDLREDGDWWIAEQPEVPLLDRAGEHSG